MARKYPLSDVASDSDTLNVDNDIVGETLSRHEPDLSDSHGRARKYRLSDVASDSDAEIVNNDIVSKTPSRHEPDLSD